MRTFKEVSTLPVKYNVESELRKIMPIHCKGEKIIALIGTVDGLDRQLNLLTSRGASVSDIIVVENHKEKFKSLDSVKDNFGFKLVFGDFINVLEKELMRGTMFSVIHFDGSESYCTQLRGLWVRFHEQCKLLHLVARASKASKARPRPAYKQVA